MLNKASTYDIRPPCTYCYRLLYNRPLILFYLGVAFPDIYRHQKRQNFDMESTPEIYPKTPSRLFTTTVRGPLTSNKQARTIKTRNYILWLQPGPRNSSGNKNRHPADFAVALCLRFGCRMLVKTHTSICGVSKTRLRNKPVLAKFMRNIKTFLVSFTYITPGGGIYAVLWWP